MFGQLIEMYQDRVYGLSFHDFLDRSTWVLATLLLVLILLSNFSLNSSQNNVDAESKLLDGNTLEQISTETIPEVIQEVAPEVPADSEEPAAIE